MRRWLSIWNSWTKHLSKNKTQVGFQPTGALIQGIQFPGSPYGWLETKGSSQCTNNDTVILLVVIWCS